MRRLDSRSVFHKTNRGTPALVFAGENRPSLMAAPNAEKAHCTGAGAGVSEAMLKAWRRDELAAARSLELLGRERATACPGGLP